MVIKMTNAWSRRKGVIVLFLDLRDGTRLESLIDIGDFSRVAEFNGKWQARWSPTAQTFYVQGRRRDRAKTMCQLPRFLAGLRKNSILVIDHLNHNGLDNRRRNFRVTDRTGNLLNRRGPQANNTSGYRGVTWDKARRKWTAFVQVRGRYIHGGRFDTVQAANRAAIGLRAREVPRWP